jgi:hypothetical protein
MLTGGKVDPPSVVPIVQAMALGDQDRLAGLRVADRAGETKKGPFTEE